MHYGTDLNRYGGLTLMPTSQRFLPLAKQVKAYLEIFDEEKRVVKYPTPTDIAIPAYNLRVNAEPFVRMNGRHICEHDVYLLTSGPGSPQMLTELLINEFYAVGRHASRLSVVCGYLPLSRSDKDEGEEELALLPHIIHLIDSASYGMLHRIIACDLHSPQCVMASKRPALITEVSMIRHLLIKVVDDALAAGFAPNQIVISLPDEGAVKRFAWAIARIGEYLKVKIPIVIGQKTRQSSESAKVNNMFGDLEQVKDSLVLGVDDEMATGSTQLQTAGEFKKSLGAKEYWSVAVHGVFCGKAVENFSSENCPIDRIYVTDTIPFDDREKQLQKLFNSQILHVVSWARELAQIISHHHWGHNIRTFR